MSIFNSRICKAADALMRIYRSHFLENGATLSWYSRGTALYVRGHVPGLPVQFRGFPVLETSPYGKLR